MPILGSSGGGGDKKREKYVFIDAASVAHSFDKFAEGVDGKRFKELDLQKLFIGQRIFYFDALPIKDENESEQDYNSRANPIEEWFAAVEKLPLFHVYTGLQKNRKKKGKEQKGVDVLLAAKVLTHAFQGNMDEIELWTSDLDFYPVLEALVNTRVRSTLRYDPRKTSDELPSYADIATPITLKDYLRTVGDEVAFSNTIDWKTGNRSNESGDTVISRGRFQGKPVIHSRTSQMNFTTKEIAYSFDSIYIESINQTATLTRDCTNPKFVVSEEPFDTRGKKIIWDDK